MLNDGNLQGDEAMIRYADATEQLKTDMYRLYDHDLLKNIEMRSGHRMHHSEFIHKILNLNPTIWVEQQINFENDFGFYTDVDGKKMFLSQLTKGWMPEFSYIVLDRAELPDSQVSGWRRCIVMLLAKGAISWKQVMKTFGDCEGVNAYRWLQVTRMFRQEDCCQKVTKNLSSAT